MTHYNGNSDVDGETGNNSNDNTYNNDNTNNNDNNSSDDHSKRHRHVDTHSVAGNISKTWSSSQARRVSDSKSKVYNTGKNKSSGIN